MESAPGHLVEMSTSFLSLSGFFFTISPFPGDLIDSLHRQLYAAQTAQQQRWQRVGMKYVQSPLLAFLPGYQSSFNLPD